MPYDFANETPDQKKKRATEIVKLLKKRYPEDPGTELKNWKTPLELLVATILSAQCTEKRVNLVTESLFKKHKSAKDYAAAKLETFEQEIKSTGFYRNKAKNIVAMCQTLLKDYGGEVPKTMDELIKLPGVGRKTANLILSICFGVPGIVTDTHVIRVSQRLGLSANKEPEKIEFDLYELIPKKDWIDFSNRLIQLGRYTCTAKHPNHGECVLKDICPSAGI